MNSHNFDFWNKLVSTTHTGDSKARSALWVELFANVSDDIKKIIVASVGVYGQCIGQPGQTVMIPGSKYRVLKDYIAKNIYNCWQDQPGWVRWTDGGNSNKQNEALTYASIFLGHYVRQGEDTALSAIRPTGLPPTMDGWKPAIAGLPVIGLVEPPATNEPYEIRKAAEHDFFGSTHSVYNKNTGALVFQGTEGKCKEIVPALALAYRQGIEHSSKLLAELAKAPVTALLSI